MHPVLRFALGIVRHPRQARQRLRELLRIAAAPSVNKAIAADSEPAKVRLIPVTAPDGLGEQLVGIYRRNPSPFVAGPVTLEELRLSLDSGIRYFLFANAQGMFVGVRAFDPQGNRLLSAVTDFPFRGKGYHLSASTKLREQLAQEGYREFRSAVLRSNTRMQRAMLAAGWHLAPDPNDPSLLRGTLTVTDPRPARPESWATPRR